MNAVIESRPLLPSRIGYPEVGAVDYPQTDLHSELLLFGIFFSFSIGAIIGSFLNVLILRLPEGRSIVSPPSQCPKCARKIHFYDNIPILSYLFLKGKCRHCGEAISFRYPLVEFSTAVISSALFINFGPNWSYLIMLMFSAALIAVFWIDLDHLIIPDAISVNWVVFGMSGSLLGIIPGMDWKSSALGFLLGGAILYIPAYLYYRLRHIEGLGGGDIKLLAMMGTFIGTGGVVFVLFFASLSGSIVAIFGLIFGHTGSKTPIPFGPFLSGAGLLYIFTGEDLIDQFYNLTSFLPILF